jgi:hypothetical protein
MRTLTLPRSGAVTSAARAASVAATSVVEPGVPTTDLRGRPPRGGVV